MYSFCICSKIFCDIMRKTLKKINKNSIYWNLFAKVKLITAFPSNSKSSFSAFLSHLGLTNCIKIRPHYIILVITPFFFHFQLVKGVKR